MTEIYNPGVSNEQDICNYINMKEVYWEYNENIRNLLFFIFGDNAEHFRTLANRVKGAHKSDIFLVNNNNQCNISVKMGSGNNIHQEPVIAFTRYLHEIGLSRQAINTLLLFHYADGTFNGTGTYRQTSHQFIDENRSDIERLVLEINQPDIRHMIIDRVLFVGNIVNPIVADIIYHGDKYYGYWGTRDEVKDYLIDADIDLSGVMISEFTYQVWNRNLNWNPATENRRHVMQLKWSGLARALDRIRV